MEMIPSPQLGFPRGVFLAIVSHMQIALHKIYTH